MQFQTVPVLAGVLAMLLRPTLAADARWPRLPAPADLPKDRPLRAGFLVVDGVYNSELMAPYDVL